MRSDEQFLGVERSLQRAWANGAGFIDEEFERPMIAVVNTYQEFSPEKVHLRQVGEAVKSGIRMAGGTPCEFNTFHVTDSETFVSVDIRYVLPSRDLVADMIELMVEGHRFDAMVLIGSGDKVVSGMVMVAARIAVPAIMLYGGPTKAGIYKNRKVFLGGVHPRGRPALRHGGDHRVGRGHRPHDLVRLPRAVHPERASRHRGSPARGALDGHSRRRPAGSERSAGEGLIVARTAGRTPIDERRPREVGSNVVMSQSGFSQDHFK